MGEVYAARDGRLGRLVALKVLPERFSSHPDRLARFEREARVLAALSHPHIAAIHGLHEGDGVSALVLEMVDGPTLADRLAAGPIPIDEALTLAAQIAGALRPRINTASSTAISNRPTSSFAPRALSSSSISGSRRRSTQCLPAVT